MWRMLFYCELTTTCRIIVGVKYCFRYNQRNRQMRNAEDGEPIDLGAMPRAHRRRREKKLMTMDEVNERFPLTKYKAWMTSRAAEGLPTAGGIATVTSRPPSVRHEDGVNKEADSQAQSSEATASTPTAPVQSSPEITMAHFAPETAPETNSSPTLNQELISTPELGADGRPSTAKTAVTAAETPNQVKPNEEAEDEEDQIQTAVPAEQLPDPGDACAICLDTIDEEDDIRGLTCGHAFHASCVDPWLTSRRACCPLCKADYYVPKPRLEGAEAADAASRRARNPNMPAPPQYAFMGVGAPFSGRRPSMVLPGRFMTIVYNENDRYGFPQVIREPRPSRAERRGLRRASSAAFGGSSDAAEATANVEAQGTAPNQNQTGPWRQRMFRNFNLSLPHPHRRSNNTNNATVEEPSPAQLEAGTS